MFRGTVGTTTSYVTYTFKKCCQLRKPAFESSGERMEILGCLSFKRKSLIWGLRQLSPSFALLIPLPLPPSLCSLPKHTGHHSVKERNSASSPAAFSQGSFPFSLVCPFASRDSLEQRVVPLPCQPCDQSFQKSRTCGLFPVPSDEEAGCRVCWPPFGKDCLEPSAGAVPRAC